MYSLGDVLLFPAKLAKGVFDLLTRLCGFRKRTGPVESPSYVVDIVVNANDTLPSYEVRRYNAFQSVSTSGPKASDRKDFMALAGYIGAAGPAQNIKSKKMSMTAPVIADGKNGRLSFTLPKSVKAAPDPLNKRVQVVQRPEATWAVHRYSGEHDRVAAKKLARALRERLVKEGYKVDSSASWEWWRYNDPRVAPELKRNEVAIKIDG
jgi:hypothetical protein